MRRFRDFLIASNLPSAASALIGGFSTLVVVLGWVPAAVGLCSMVVVLIRVDSHNTSNANN